MTQQSSTPSNQPDQPNPIRSLTRKLVIELSIYLILIILYFLFVKISLEDLMYRLFNENLGLYGLIGISIIVFQGVVIEIISTFLTNQITMDRFE
jgi:hypothetical protein